MLGWEGSFEARHTGPSGSFRFGGMSVFSGVVLCNFIRSFPMEEIYKFFAARPLAQRAFLAFTVAMFVACAAQVSAHPHP